MVSAAEVTPVPETKLVGTLLGPGLEGVVLNPLDDICEDHQLPCPWCGQPDGGGSPEGLANECEVPPPPPPPPYCDSFWSSYAIYRDRGFLWFTDWIQGQLVGKAECQSAIYQIDVTAHMEAIGGTSSSKLERCPPNPLGPPTCMTVTVNSWPNAGPPAQKKDTGPGTNCFRGEVDAEFTASHDHAPGNELFPYLYGAVCV